MARARSEERVDSMVSSLPRLCTRILGMSPGPGEVTARGGAGAGAGRGAAGNDSELQMLSLSRRLSLDLLPRLSRSVSVLCSLCAEKLSSGFNSISQKYD